MIYRGTAISVKFFIPDTAVPLFCLLAKLSVSYSFITLSDSLHIPFRPHSSHLGERAVQTYLPCNISQWCAVGTISLGMYFMRYFSVASGVVHDLGTSPILWLTLKTCVSTAIAALLNTTL